MFFEACSSPISPSTRLSSRLFFLDLLLCHRPLPSRPSSIRPSVHPSTPPALHRHHYRGRPLGLVHSSVFPPSSSPEREKEAIDGYCMEAGTEWMRGGMEVLSCRSDSSVRGNECGALGGGVRGAYRRVPEPNVSMSTSVNDLVHTDSLLDVRG